MTAMGQNDLDASKHGDIVQTPVQKLSRLSLQRGDVRAWCVTMVVLSTLLSVTAIVLGAITLRLVQPLPAFMENKCIEWNGLQLPYVGISVYRALHVAFPSTQAASIIIQYTTNAILTLVIDSHTRISSTALLWFLRDEEGERPWYNTNSRFLNGTKQFGPCHWSINAIAAISIAIVYGAASTLTSRIHVLGFSDESCILTSERLTDTAWGVDISGYPLMILGIALLVLSLISVWTLVLLLGPRKSSIKTWSSDPVVNAIFMILIGGAVPIIEHEEHGAVRSSVYKQVPRARWLIRIVWITFGALGAATGVTGYYAMKADSYAIVAREDIWQSYGQVWVNLGNNSTVTDWAGILVQAGMQGLLAFAMHCADVVVAFMNDDVSWQDAYMRYAEDSNAFVPRKYRFKWRNLITFSAKSGIQFVFGYAISVDILFTVSLIPLTVVAAIILLMAIMLEVMARRQPKDGAPTTYGEFKLLIKFISRYHLTWL